MRHKNYRGRSEGIRHKKWGGEQKIERRESLWNRKNIIASTEAEKQKKIWLPSPILHKQPSGLRILQLGPHALEHEGKSFLSIFGRRQNIRENSHVAMSKNKIYGS